MIQANPPQSDPTAFDRFLANCASLLEVGLFFALGLVVADIRRYGWFDGGIPEGGWDMASEAVKTLVVFVGLIYLVCCFLGQTRLLGPSSSGVSFLDVLMILVVTFALVGGLMSLLGYF